MAEIEDTKTPDQLNMSFIDRAKALKVRKDYLTHNGMGENDKFWETHDTFIHQAWQEFGLGDPDL